MVDVSNYPTHKQTYDPIATVTSSSTVINISNIPGTYKDLVLVCRHINNGDGASAFITFNGDTSQSYSRTALYGYNNSVYSVRASNATRFETAGDDSDHMNVVHIMSYANTNVYKTFLDSFDGPGRIVGQHVGLWRNTAAITSIDFSTDLSWISPVSLSLYGIAG